jgi:hypothetical protein
MTQAYQRYETPREDQNDSRNIQRGVRAMMNDIQSPTHIARASFRLRRCATAQSMRDIHVRL